MKRIGILLVLFLLLGGGTLWYLSVGEEESPTTLGWDRKFAVKDVSTIGKIFIADRQGNKTTLVRKGDGWIYNNKYPAKPNAVENLLDAVRRVEVKYKPPRAAEEQMIKSLATEGIKVEIYDKSGESMKTYYVGGATTDERGTYMMLENADQPYVNYIPSWEGNIRFRYSLTDDAWRDETVLAFKPEDIQKVSVEYPKQRNKSFILERSPNDFELRPFHAVTPVINKPMIEGMTEAYLVGFQSLIAEGFENKNPGRDSITSLVPFSVISVTDIKGNTHTVKLFPIYPKHSSVDPKTGLVVNTEFPVERYFVDHSNGDFFLMQHRNLKKVLWAYEFFFDESTLQ